MTNSAKQTKKDVGGKVAPKVDVGGKVAPKIDAGGQMPSYATGDFWIGAVQKRPALLLGVFLLIIGWGFILHINRWHLTVPVVMLWLGWAGVIATARFLWWAGIAMASDQADDSNEQDRSIARLRELADEKKVLLRAIKEIEFDRDLGKMSANDATEIMRFYRARAIEVIKEIDGQSDEELTIPERIARDLQARLAVETQRSAGSKDTPAQKAERIKRARANAELAAEAKAKAELETASDDSPSDDSPSDDSSSDDSPGDHSPSDDSSSDDSPSDDSPSDDSLSEDSPSEDSSSDEPPSDDSKRKPSNETPDSSEDDVTEAAESA